MLPRVDGPLPETIGLSVIVTAATTGGVIMLVLAVVLRLPARQKTMLGELGVVIGFAVGLVVYLLALGAQLLCRQ